MDTISNTTVISNFAVLDQLDLLRQLYGVLHIPTEVHAEIRSGIDDLPKVGLERATRLSPVVAVQFAGEPSGTQSVPLSG